MKTYYNGNFNTGQDDENDGGKPEASGSVRSPNAGKVATSGSNPVAGESGSTPGTGSNLQAELQRVTQERDRLYTQLTEEFKGVVCIRCMRHTNVPQQNKNEHAGGECGACIAEELDKERKRLEWLLPRQYNHRDRLSIDREIELAGKDAKNPIPFFLTRPTTSEIKLLFEQWWLLEGQYTCASGQPNHKDVVFTAWLSGWDSLNRLFSDFPVRKLTGKAPDQWSQASGPSGKTEHWHPDLVGWRDKPVFTNCNACGRALHGEAELAMGLCTVCNNEYEA